MLAASLLLSVVAPAASDLGLIYPDIGGGVKSFSH